jgi:hypothetical protein
MNKSSYQLFFLLFVLNLPKTFSQIVDPDYKNYVMDHKRLIIAPIILIDSVDENFSNKYPNMKNPKDSLIMLLEREFAIKARKCSQFYSLYSSTYRDMPTLQIRTLYLDKTDSLTILLPLNGTKVRMKLIGQVPTEPDFILFLQIGSIEINGEMLLKNVRYVFWDNVVGKIAVFNQGDIDIWKNLYDEKYPFAKESKYLELLGRFVFTKTPFSNPNMLRYDKNEGKYYSPSNFH